MQIEANIMDNKKIIGYANIESDSLTRSEVYCNLLMIDTSHIHKISTTNSLFPKAQKRPIQIHWHNSHTRIQNAWIKSTGRLFLDGDDCCAEDVVLEFEKFIGA